MLVGSLRYPQSQAVRRREVGLWSWGLSAPCLEERHGGKADVVSLATAATCMFGAGGTYTLLFP